ncbi:hypothetical protein V8E36_005389 [Tilletia maclaganii]
MDAGSDHFYTQAGGSSSTSIDSESGYNSGACTPQAGAFDTSAAAAAPAAALRTPGTNMHQRKRSSVSVPLRKPTPRAVREEPKDNTFSTTTRQELSWDDVTPQESPEPQTSHQRPHSHAPSLSLSSSSGAHQYGIQAFSQVSSPNDYSRPTSIIQGRPFPKRKGTLGYVSSSASHPPNGQLPESAASSLSSHQSSPRSVSVYGGSMRERQRTTSGWSSNGHDVTLARKLSLTPSSISHSPAGSITSKFSTPSDRAANEEGATLLTVYKDLLSAIASKQRTCAELRQELEREEADLRDLQRLWEAQIQRELSAQGSGMGPGPAASAAAAASTDPSYAPDSYNSSRKANTGLPQPASVGFTFPGPTISPSPSSSFNSKGAHLGSTLGPGDASSSSASSTATDTFRKLLGNLGLGTPSISTPSASHPVMGRRGSGASATSGYFPLPSSASASGPRSAGNKSSASSAASSPHGGTPLEGLSDAEEAEIMAHFQPRDLDKERADAERAKQQAATKDLSSHGQGGTAGVISIVPPQSGKPDAATAADAERYLSSPSSSSSLFAAAQIGQNLERAGNNKTPTPLSAAGPGGGTDTGGPQDGQILSAGPERKTSIAASEGSEVRTPRLQPTAQIFSISSSQPAESGSDAQRAGVLHELDTKPRTPTAVPRINEPASVAVLQDDQQAASTERTPAIVPASQRIGRKMGSGLGGGSALFPTQRSVEIAATTAADSSSSSTSSRASTSTSSATTSGASSASTSSSKRDASSTSSAPSNSSSTAAGVAGMNTSSFPAWGAKRFSMLGDTLSAFGAKVEEQFALAAAAAAATASNNPPSPSPVGSPVLPSSASPALAGTGNGPGRRGSEKGVGPNGQRQDRGGVANGTSSVSAGSSAGVGSSASRSTGEANENSAAQLSTSAAGLTSALSAWSSKRLKEAGTFLANAERTIGNALVLDDPSLTSHPHGSQHQGSGNGQAKRGSTSGEGMNGGGGNSGRPGSPEWHRQRLFNQSLAGASQARSGSPSHSANGGPHSSRPLSPPGGAMAERSVYELEASREREALRGSTGNYGAQRERERAQSPATVSDSSSLAMGSNSGGNGGSKHVRSSSILSSGAETSSGTTTTAGSSSSNNSHRRSLSLSLSRPSSILSSAEAGVSSLFGMLSNALAVPPEEEGDEEREREWERGRERARDWEREGEREWGESRHVGSSRAAERQRGIGSAKKED